MSIVNEVREKLLALETQVSDDKLFLVGYLIPMVDLVPNKGLSDLEWFAEFAIFVEDAVEADGLSDADVDLLIEIIETLQPE